MDGDTAGRSHDLTRPAPSPAAPTAPVWDLGVRVFHWSLVVTVATALVTGFLAPRWWLDVHVAAGTVVAALLVFRILWGFWGSTYARFGSFLVSPITALTHAFDLMRGKADHHTGHNPVGTMMIVALLAALFALTATGTLWLGGGLKEGPLAPVVSYATGSAAKDIHAWLGWGLLALIAGHVSGVIFDSLRTRENLVRAMVTGRKAVHPGAHAAPAVAAKPIRTALAFVGLSAIFAPAIILASNQPVPGVPPPTLDPVYAKECAACHSPHHPSLAQAAVWSQILDGLSDHFGDNASLEPAQIAHLRTYLTANAAQTWDTLAAVKIGPPDPTGSLRITRAPGWKAIHADIPEDRFSAKAVNGKLNCAACHADQATGRFAARSIAFPIERTTP